MNLKQFYSTSFYYGLIVVLAAPLMVHAQSLSGAITQFQGLIDRLLPVLASLALLGFFYGLVKYVFNADNEEARQEAKQVIIAGIVALFLMASIGGIINFLTNAINFGSDNSIDTPTLEMNSSG